MSSLIFSLIEASSRKADPYHQNTTRQFATKHHLSVLIGTKVSAAEYETALVSTS